MAEFVLTDASVVINAVDLSSRVRSVTINYEAEAQDRTAMGDTTREQVGGLKNWSMDVEFNQDFAASNVDATLFGIVGTGVTVTVKPTSGAVSATNPSFSGTGMIQSYPPLGGTVGDLATTTVHIEPQGVLTRATA